MTDYSKLPDDEIKSRAGSIMRSTPNNDELRRRLKDELGYPYYALIAGCGPDFHMDLCSVESDAKSLAEQLTAAVAPYGFVRRK